MRKVIILVLAMIALLAIGGLANGQADNKSRVNLTGTSEQLSAPPANVEVYQSAHLPGPGPMHVQTYQGSQFNPQSQ